MKTQNVVIYFCKDDKYIYKKNSMSLIIMLLVLK